MELLEKKAIAWFEHLHRHPELSAREYETTKFVQQALAEEGIEIIPWQMETGVLAVVRGEKPGPVIALRADMDALPVQEETDLPYASQNPGVMHACGHDFHTAMMLAAASLLQRNRASLSGTVKIVFQPDEEMSGGGARTEATGLLRDVSWIFAGHTYPAMPAGWLGIKEGPVMAAADYFSVRLRGKGAHAAKPHLSRDPVPALCDLVSALQTLVSRRVDPFSPAVITVGHLEAGNTWNVIPETAMLEGTARAMEDEVMARLREEFTRVTEGVCAAHGVEPEIRWDAGSPAVYNDPTLCALARRVAGEMPFEVGIQENTMGAEDFSALASGKPHLFVRVGTGGDYVNHHPKFTADPKALYPAARFFANLAEEALRELNR